MRRSPWLALLLVHVACNGGGGPETEGADDPDGDSPPGADDARGDGDTPPPGDPPPGDPGEPPITAEFGMEQRPSNTSCLALPRPPNESGVRLEPAFPNLTFDDPVGLVHQRLYTGDDASWRFFIVEQGGLIRVVARPEAPTTSVFLDLTSVVQNFSENGLLALALPPDYTAAPGTGNHSVYVTYIAGTPEGTHACPGNRLNERLCFFLSRLQITTPDAGRTFEAGSVEVLMRMQKPYETHNGGQAVFGPDGLLYVSTGDGGLAYDPHCNGQNLNTPLSKVLRIDVSSGARPYAVPSTNPFASEPRLCNDHLYAYATEAYGNNPDLARDAPCPETWAWGLRNPWRMSIDRLTGGIWIGDTGQDQREEVLYVQRGDNHGWNTVEGTASMPDWSYCRNADPTHQVPPKVEYEHIVGRAAIIGGYVYRGSALVGHTGSYFFMDAGTGELWSIKDPYTQESLLNPEPLLAAGGFVSSMGEGGDGELYALDLYGGPGTGVMKLVPDNPPDTPPLPVRLSQTGCVESGNPKKPAPGLIPYDVNSPLWSDGARKERYLAIPDGTSIEVDADGHLELPIGSVLVKMFRVGDRLVETRLLMRHEDGDWAGYTYVWNTEQTDAYLADAHIDIDTPSQTWGVPSRTECLGCHTDAAGRSLGLTLGQLNGTLVYPGGIAANQLATLEHIGITEVLPSSLPVQVDPYADGPLEERARSYLAANCSHCHRPGGTATGTSMDLRYGTPLAETRTCGLAPLQGNLGIQGALILAPGDPTHSLLYRRIDTTSSFLRMPPIARTLIDTEAAALMKSWVQSLDACP